MNRPIRISISLQSSLIIAERDESLGLTLTPTMQASLTSTVVTNDPGTRKSKTDFLDQLGTLLRRDESSNMENHRIRHREFLHAFHRA